MSLSPPLVLACIAREATLYGTEWSSDSRDARKLFAGVRYVACDESCPGVSAYPTWELRGERYLGRMTVEQLRRAAGC